MIGFEPDRARAFKKTVQWTVFSEGREALAEQGQIATQYASCHPAPTKKVPRLWNFFICMN